MVYGVRGDLRSGELTLSAWSKDVGLQLLALRNMFLLNEKLALALCVLLNENLDERYYLFIRNIAPCRLTCAIA